jgi:hypothetical protein
VFADRGLCPESASCLCLGVTMHQDIIMQAVCVWAPTPHHQYQADPASTASSGAQLFHLARLRHEKVTTVAGTSTPFIHTSGTAPMTP